MSLILVVIIFAFLILVIFISLRTNYKTLTLILIFSMYINLLKPIFESRWPPIFIDISIGVLLMKIMIFKKFAKEGSLIHFPVINMILIVFLIISFLQIFNPNVPSFLAGLYGFRKTCYQMLAFFLGVYYIKNYLEINQIMKYLLYFSIPVLIYGIKQFFWISSFDEKLLELNLADFDTHVFLGKIRAFSIFSGPFHFGMFSCIIFLMALYFYLNNKRLFYLILCLLSAVGVLASMTRINMIALAVSLLWFANLGKYALIRKSLIIFGIPFILLIIFTSIELFSPLNEAFASISKFYEDQRFLERFIGYRMNIQAIIEQPLLGYGMGSAADTMEEIYSFKVRFVSHNIVLKILTETGIMGLLFFLIFFVMWFKKVFVLSLNKDKLLKNVAILITSMVIVLLINGITGSAIEAYPINMWIWFFMGAIVRCCK